MGYNLQCFGGIVHCRNLIYLRHSDTAPNLGFAFQALAIYAKPLQDFEYGNAAVTFKAYTNNAQHYHYKREKRGTQRFCMHWLPFSADLEENAKQPYMLRFLKYIRTPELAIASSIITDSAHVVKCDSWGEG